jgi:hypothetical protein
LLITVIRTDGREEIHEIPDAARWETVLALLEAATLDHVRLKDGRIMLVNGDGYEIEVIRHEDREAEGVDLVLERRPTRARLPVNAKATALYHEVCKPGTTHAIVGDVAILPPDGRQDEDG